MSIASFTDLLNAARRQPEPQSLLFVFARAELPEDASAEEAERFAAGRGGALAPIMFVDKKAADLRNFDELVQESRHTGQHWDLVFVGCLGGRGGRDPGDEEAQHALETMVKSVQGGRVAHLLAFRPNGEQVQFS